MATISSLGIGSGLDLSSIVSGLVDAERVPAERRLDAREESLSTKLSAFGALKSSLSLFQGSLSNLNSSTSFSGKEATVSDDSVLSTFATSFADSASYSVEVTALAKAHSLASSADTAFSSVDDTVGSGTLTIQFGETSTGPYSFSEDSSKATQTISVNADNNNTTLSGLRDYINNNDFGVNAAIVNDGNGFRLTLTSEQTGAKNSMEITVTNDGDGIDDDNSGLSQLAFNADAQLSMGQTVQAQDATLKINGLEISRENNSVTGAIDGVTLNLLKADIGNVLSVDVSANTEGIKSAVEEFVEGYNGLVETINSLTDYDPGDDSVGILIGDFTVRSITSQLRATLSTATRQLESSFQSLADIGIKTVDDGFLQLDSIQFDEALSSSAEDVASLFRLQGRSSDTGVSYISASERTIQGNFNVNITTMASQAVFNGSTLNALVIDANNDEFTVSVDGTASNTITLNQATYASGSELAAHMQAQINADANLKAAGASVQVVYDSNNNELDITSQKFGSASSISVLSVDTNTANDIGLSIGSGQDGSDIVGTINGQPASGSGQILSSSSGASAGLVLSVTSGTTGNRGSLTFTRGIASALDNLLSNFVDTTGFISSREEGFNNELDQLAEQRAELNLKIDTLEARLVQQFSALDGLIASFNSTSSFLTQQLANLPEPNSINKRD